MEIRHQVLAKRKLGLSNIISLSFFHLLICICNSFSFPFLFFSIVFLLVLFGKLWGAGCFTAPNGDKYPQMWDQGLPAMTSTLIEMLGVTQEVDEEEGLEFVEEVIYTFN